MDYFNRLLKSLPDRADVWADAHRRYGADTFAGSHYAAGLFEGQVEQLRRALACLLDDPKADAPATADELAGLEVPPLEEVEASR